MTKQPKRYDSVCRNKKALHSFEVLERLECGLVLRGSEVKSIRERNVSIDEAYVVVDERELWLIGCHIAAYQFDHLRKPEPLRRRKLLARSGEIAKLKIRVEQKGLTLVPLRVYFDARGLAKVTLGIVRGKKGADKRDDLKARDAQREIERAMRGRG